MKKIKIYLDSSVISHLFADDSPERKLITEELFNVINAETHYEFFISDIVINEISKTPDFHLREKLLNAAKNNNIHLLDYNESVDEVKSLAMKYLSQGALPSSSVDDSLHVAIVTIYEIDILLSWNYKHLANINRERRFHSINFNEGYNYPIRITNPMEVINEG